MEATAPPGDGAAPASLAPSVSMSSNMSTMVFEGPGQGKTVKRPRPVKSCNSCRQRKLRCDRTCPCSQCRKSCRVCKYANDQDGGSDVSDSEMSPRPAKRVQRSGPSMKPDATPIQGGGGGVSNGGGGEFRSGSASSSVLEDHGARLERLERAVFSKPSSSSFDLDQARHHHQAGGYGSGVPPISAASRTIRGLSVKGDLRTRFFGQNSTRVLLNLFPEARAFVHNQTRSESVRELMLHLQNINKAMQEEHRKALSPITVFIDSMVPVQKRMADILPKKASCDRLLDAYIGASEGLYRVVHLPSFRAEYELYWQGKVAPDGFLPRLLCMLAIGARFETDSRGLGHDRTDSVHVPTACALVRVWLDGLRGKQLVDMNMLQGELLLLHAQRMMASRHHDAWMQLGLIVRMAMTMGLHRDPAESPQISPFWAELRRRTWHTIVDMDLHVALACNLPCAVREGEYSCRAPANLDDDDLSPDMPELPPPRPIDQYTSTQLQAYAARTLPHRLRVAGILGRLDSLRDYGEVLDCGRALERILDDINHLFPRNRAGALDPRGKYKEWRMRALLDMHVRRPLLSLYRPFALGTGGDCPPDVTATYLKSSMVMLTYLDELDPMTPGFADVSHMYSVVLKHDIMQSAFSVAYFVRAANLDQSTVSASAAAQLWDQGGGGGGDLGEQQEGVGGSWDSTDARAIWSPAGMTKTVEKSLDSLIALVKDSSYDIKDLVTLSVVLDSVKSPADSPDQRNERMKAGVRRIIDACLLALKASPESLRTLSVLPSTPASIDRLQTPDTYMLPRHPSIGTGDVNMAEFLDDTAFWDLDMWDTPGMQLGKQPM